MTTAESLQVVRQYDGWVILRPCGDYMGDQLYRVVDGPYRTRREARRGLFECQVIADCETKRFEAAG